MVASVQVWDKQRKKALMVVTVTRYKNYRNLAQFVPLKPTESLYLVLKGKRLRPIRSSIKYRRRQQ